MNLDFNLNFNFGKSSDLFNFDFQDIKIETEPPELEIPKQENQENIEVKLPEPKPEIEDTFVAQTHSESNGDPWLSQAELVTAENPKTEIQTVEVDPNLFKVDENQENIFQTGQIDINDPNIKWEISDIKIDALKFDPNAFKNVDYSWVQSLQASGVKFAVLDKNLSTQNPNEMDFQTLKATTEKLLTTSTINSDQKRVLELLQSDLKKIESDAKSQNLDPNKLLEQEKKDKIAKWEKYAVTLSAVNEQDAANRFSIYKDNGIFTEFFTQGEDSKLIKELQSVRQRLEQNQYRSISEKQKDLERAAVLESEFEAIQNLGSEGIPKERVNLYNEIVENGWKNREPITKQIQDINNGVTNRIKELEDKGSLSDAEKNELSFLKEKKAEIEELTKKALSKEGYKDFLDGYARLILDLKEKNPELAEELINGVKDGKIDITRFFESRAKYGDEGEKKKAKQILTDIFSSQDFAKILKISSEEKNKYIISNGGLLQVQQDLNLSNDVTASLKN